MGLPPPPPLRLCCRRLAHAATAKRRLGPPSLAPLEAPPPLALRPSAAAEGRCCLHASSTKPSVAAVAASYVCRCLCCAPPRRAGTPCHGGALAPAGPRAPAARHRGQRRGATPCIAGGAPLLPLIPFFFLPRSAPLVRQLWPGRRPCQGGLTEGRLPDAPPLLGAVVAECRVPDGPRHTAWPATRDRDVAETTGG